MNTDNEIQVYVEYPEEGVRIIFRPSYVARDLVVQEYNGEGWTDLSSYNEMSDDYAFVNSQKSARDFIKQRAATPPSKSNKEINDEYL